jgi:hypothetical protein
MRYGNIGGEKLYTEMRGQAYIDGSLMINRAQLTIVAVLQTRSYVSSPTLITNWNANLGEATISYLGMAAWDTPTTEIDPILNGIKLTTAATSTSSLGSYTLNIHGDVQPQWICQELNDD